MKKSIGSVFIVLVFLTILLSGCAPASTPVPSTFTPSPKLPTFSATATPSNSVQLTKVPLTANNGLAHYRGPNPYRSSPSFDVAYDPSVWKFIEKDGSGIEPKLIHRNIPQCTVWLGAGPVGVQPLSTTKIAEYEWTISRVQPNIVDYSTPLDDIYFIFGLILPDTYTETVKSPCQQSMEDVLQTFKVVRD